MIKFLSTTLYALFIAMLLGVAGLFLASMLPIPGNIEIKIVKSGSMEPAIMTGSIVVVKPQVNYVVGDVITFGADTATQIPTTHRIMEITQNELGQTVYVTKGDANEEVDGEVVRADTVIGKVVFSAPYAGFVLDFARQPYGFFFMIGVPAGFIILEEIIKIVREMRAIVRRRRGGPDDEDQDSTPSRSNADEDEGVMYLRRSRMDEIYVPTRVSLSLAVAERAIDVARESVVRGREHYGGLFVGVICVAVLSVSGAVGTTVAYFADFEESVANVLQAGGLDFTVAGGQTAEFSITASSSVFLTTTFTPTATSTLPMQYRILAEQTGGDNDFCSALRAEATSTPTYGVAPLIGMVTGTTTAIGAWYLNVTVPVASTSALTAGDQCMIDIIYRGWHEERMDETGYDDEERISLTFTFATTTSLLLALNDPQDIVLNEFLPNPSGVAYGFDFGNDASNMPQGEWVELYNNGNTPQDLSGWYISDESGGLGNQQAIISVANTQPATTTIPAHGWLVVYFNKPVLNNTGDSIFLYAPDGTLVDSYTYDNPSAFCENEPTPETPNASSTPALGSCPGSQVAPNKSYARIPDGTGAFVDPIPTPGSFNIPEPVSEEPSAEDVSGGGESSAAGESQQSGDGSGGTTGSPTPESESGTSESQVENSSPATPVDSPEVPAEASGEPAQEENQPAENPTPEEGAAEETPTPAEPEPTPDPTPDPTQVPEPTQEAQPATESPPPADVPPPPDAPAGE